MNADREKLVAWVACELRDRVANLGYPAGMGSPPSATWCAAVASDLVEHIASQPVTSAEQPK